jgi:dipeptidyl aminopeptidase/acylaminoacyl peptidase
LYEINPPNGKKRIIIHSVGTGQERELLPDLENFQFSTWSPDGQSILVDGTDVGCRDGYFRIDVETGNATILVQANDGEVFHIPEFSPDGRTILYQRTNVSTQRNCVVASNLETGNDTELYCAPHIYLTALSPNGDTLAFGIDDRESRSAMLNIMPARGGEPRELLRLEESSRIEWLWWMPGGNDIVVFFKRLGKQNSELMRVSAETGRPLPLWDPPTVFGAFHPDGRRVAVAWGHSQDEIWAMENFLPTE